MAGGDSFHDGDQLGTTTTTAATNPSFSQLLFASDDDVANDMSHLFDYSSVNSSKMLCFGTDYQTEILHQPTTITTTQTSGLTCNDNSSSVTHIAHNATLNVLTKFNRKRNETLQGGGQCKKTTVAKTTVASQRTTKKTKSETNTTSPTGHAKVRKEKLGERITALQMLVSPYGKTDTASVLHEAMGYIKFLHDQVQVLCSPYLQHLPVVDGENGVEEKVKDLRSGGLCLVPVDSTMHAVSSNGADYWSPATMGNFSSSSSNKP